MPDGEILAGSPIPAVVPLPGAALAPMPGPVEIVKGQLAPAKPGDAYPGYPFFVPGIAGHRPPEPPRDSRANGGLERHVVADGKAKADPLVDGDQRSLYKHLEWIKPFYLPEKGTPAELRAMDFHAQANHPTVDTLGNPSLFLTNGRPPVDGAPYSDPCPAGAPLKKFQAAVFQLDLIFNKKGWHTPQARMLALRDDVLPTLEGARAPQPFFFRVNSGDCIEYEHSNIVPAEWQQDAFQVKTPTDIIGQHIHLVKFDVTSSDGGGNGFNYEDGTASYEEVQDRIRAIRTFNKCAAWSGPSEKCPRAEKHPWYGKDYMGGRVTVQRWYADPQLMPEKGTPVGGDQLTDKTLETVFTHDHFGASTHQQAGLYAGLIVEPKGSHFLDENELVMGGRRDGGPTSWKAIIENQQGKRLREFGILYQDFHIAYKKFDKPNDTTMAINAPGQVAIDETPPNILVKWQDRCTTWPHCPEAVSADDIGAASINYRSEPAPLRLLGNGTNPAEGNQGDLAYLFQSIPRADADLNRDPASYPLVGLEKNPKRWPLLSPRVGRYDPFTPLLETWADETFKIRLLAGAHEHEHSFTLNGVSWLDMPHEPNSGYRGFVTTALSEHHEIVGHIDLPGGGVAHLDGAPASFDFLYKVGASVDDVWYGNWGILRAYPYRRPTQAGNAARLAMAADPNQPPELPRLDAREKSAGKAVTRAEAGLATGDAVLDNEPTKQIDRLLGAYQRRYLDAFEELGGPGNPANLATPKDAAETSMAPYRARVQEMGQLLDQAMDEVNAENSMLAEATARQAQGGPATFEQALLEEAADLRETLELVDANLSRLDRASAAIAMPEMPKSTAPLPTAKELRGGMSPQRLREVEDVMQSAREALPKVVEITRNTAVGEFDIDRSGTAVCPPDAPLRAYAISAVAAQEALAGGTLTYHRFPKPTPGAEDWLTVDDPTALLYVRDRYLTPDKTQLDPSYKVEPLVLRAHAGDCIEIHLTNRLPERLTDLPGYNTLPNITQGFNFNQLGVSNQVGLHLQGLRYHVTESDGINVGRNPRQTIGPGERRIYRFYAGRLESRGEGPTYVPIEFGVVNLMPADPIKQNSKGLVGALVIEPPGTVWAHDLVPPEPPTRHADGSVTSSSQPLISRASATVFSLGETGRYFRDLVLVGQDDANFQLRSVVGGNEKVVPVRRVAQAAHCAGWTCTEAAVSEEESDAVDSGHKAFNYRSEALWMRRHLPAAKPLDQTLALPAFDVLSNNLPTAGGLAGQTPRFCLEKGDETRLRLAFPGGHGRNHILHVHGHNFYEWPFTENSTVLGNNGWSFGKGSQDGVGPGSYFNLLFTHGAGGSNAIAGDYLIRDQYSWGFDGGLWAQLHVTETCPELE